MVLLFCALLFKLINTLSTCGTLDTFMLAAVVYLETKSSWGFPLPRISTPPIYFYFSACFCFELNDESTSFVCELGST